jgi:hypothetical protein
VFNYTSSKSRATYMLNTNLLSQEDAQTFCNDQGGHLAGYDSLAEQIEVEQRFIKDVGGSRTSQAMQAVAVCRVCTPLLGWSPLCRLLTHHSPLFPAGCAFPLLSPGLLDRPPSQQLAAVWLD